MSLELYRHSRARLHGRTTAWMQDDYTDVRGRVVSGTTTEIDDADCHSREGGNPVINKTTDLSSI